MAFAPGTGAPGGLDIASMLPMFQGVSAAISAFGALQSGNAAKTAAKYNAKINEQNADLALADAADQARVLEREQYLRTGAIRAAQGASGGRQEGSVLDVIADVAAQGELEKQMILYRGQLKARGYRNAAQMDEYSGDTAKTGSYLKAGTELLGGALNTYKSYTQLKRTN